MTSTNDATSCPHMSTKTATSNQKWWPNQLNLKILNQNVNNPDSSFDYAKEFLSLPLHEVKRDIAQLLTTSQPFWPADYAHYGPFMIRMAWHSAGTYRITDGRGGANTGNLRFAPLNSWPDNANLDKAKRLLWPIKQKYGRKISYQMAISNYAENVLTGADLMILTGNVALETMGFKTFAFAGGREDIYAPEDDVYWGPEETWLADERYPSKLDRTSLEKPLGAVQMGLIYVNPEGPNGNSDPLLAAKDIRETFARMAMNDEETVALIAGGHTFGKCHGAGDTQNVGPEPEGAPIEQQGLGWISSFNSGKGRDAITSGLEGAWTVNPAKWDHGYFDNLFRYDWVKTKSPAGATQWIPSATSAQTLVPDAHDKVKRHAPIMLTTDLALRFDPIYGPISKRFHENADEFATAFAKAWFKLTHRDMGPLSRYLGPEVPREVLLWQDPIPNTQHFLPERDVILLKRMILNSGLSIPQLVRVAWASACTYRRTDHRGGANGGRIRLQPQNNWPVNRPEELDHVLTILKRVRREFGKEVSIADMVVLGGCAAIESAAKSAGHVVQVPFSPGRTDASQEQTDVESFAFLEPTSDGFRNYLCANVGQPAEELLVDRAQMLGLSAPEMTVLVGGMRVLNTSHELGLGVLTSEPGTLTNDFFVNLLHMNTIWKPTKDKNVFEGYDFNTNKVVWKASRVDLIFGSNSELRAIAEYYACDDSCQVFVQDFVKAWNKVMNADRFDLKEVTLRSKL